MEATRRRNPYTISRDNADRPGLHLAELQIAHKYAAYCIPDHPSDRAGGPV